MKTSSGLQDTTSEEGPLSAVQNRALLTGRCRGWTADLAGLFCVKCVHDVQVEVALQPQDVIVPSMQHLCDRRIRKDAAQDVKVIM